MCRQPEAPNGRSGRVALFNHLINEVMKKYLFLFTLVGFLATQAHATPTSPRKTKPSRVAATVEKQLANYISYPDVLRPTQRAGVVVIQFRVNADNELCQLAVFSQNEEINNSLTKQLTGKKLIGCGSDAAQLHTVRLRFQPE